MKLIRTLATALACAAVTPAMAQEAPANPPKLIVVISVDQFSADLYAEYRSLFRAGFTRLGAGAVFPSGYQSHAATETCPGHSTILTGNRPAHTGIIANDWYDLKTAREDKEVYCAEDESVPGSTSSKYTVSDTHLKVPTLGEWMKAANPASRVVAVAGKDRAAVMMGGHDIDQIWYWGGKSYVSYAGRSEPEIVTRMNASVAQRIAQAQPAMPLPEPCASRDIAVPVGSGTTGTGRFARAAGDAKAFRASPEFDEATLALAAGMIEEMQLGKGDAPDLIAIGASGTDVIGHGYGTRGTEMCLQLLSLDAYLGKLLAVLDKSGVDYVVALTADHGGHDAPERIRMQAGPTAARADAGLSAAAVGKEIAAETGLKGKLLWGSNSGDMWVDPALTPAQRIDVVKRAQLKFAKHPQVAAALTREEIMATPMPSTPPETWTMNERARASFDPERSGDLVIALKPRVTPIVNGGPGYVATHGSFWDYDRRVPILFWRKGMTPFEQPLSVETVDIAPTLAALLDVKPTHSVDGRCLDLDAGAGDTCE